MEANLRNNALWRRQYVEATKKEIFDILGRKCSWCGFDDARALQIDHINGDGYEERAKHGGSTYRAILKKLRDGSKDYQTLCANCNAIKRYMAKEGLQRIHEGEWVRRELKPCGTPAAYRRGV